MQASSSGGHKTRPYDFGGLFGMQTCMKQVTTTSGPFNSILVRLALINRYWSKGIREFVENHFDIGGIDLTFASEKNNKPQTKKERKKS